MRKLATNLAQSAALAGGVLLVAAAPCLAQASPIVTGDVEFLHPIGGLLGTELSLLQLPNGTLDGGGTMTIFATNGVVDFDLTS